jgi:hypothetical protein
MLKYGEANPLDVFGLRELGFCPPHFEQITFDLRANEKDIVDWIYENLSGRFYIGDHFAAEQDAPSRVNMQKVVGFELHEEASYFGLFLPNINVVSYEF